MTRTPRLLVVFSSLLLLAPLSAEALFLRGNSNGDDKLDIAGPIHTLGYLKRYPSQSSWRRPPCSHRG